MWFLSSDWIEQYSASTGLNSGCVPWEGKYISRPGEERIGVFSDQMDLLWQREFMLPKYILGLYLFPSLLCK